LLAETEVALASRGAVVYQHEATINEHEATIVNLKRELRQEVGQTNQNEDTIIQLKETLKKVSPGKGGWKEPADGRKGDSTRCKQRRRLEKAGKQLFTEEGSYNKRIAEAVVAKLLQRDKDVEEVVEESVWFQSKVRAMAKATIGAVQARMDHCGLAVKVIGKISWGRDRTIRRVISYQFEEPEDLSYSTKGDIGKYARWELGLQPDSRSGLRTELTFDMPSLPSYDHCKTEESAIIARSGGYVVSPDGECVTLDFDSVLRTTLERHWDVASRLDIYSGSTDIW
jgi:hypothetical protein